MPQHKFTTAAAMDAVAYFASREVILAAADALDRGEFTAWAREAQTDGATELRALADTYHPVDCCETNRQTHGRYCDGSCEMARSQREAE